MNTLKAIGNRDGIPFVQITPDLIRRLVEFLPRKGFCSLRFGTHATKLSTEDLFSLHGL
jgi:hypothetical protein